MQAAETRAIARSKAILGLLLALLSACTPLLDLESPCPCDVGASDDDAFRPRPLDVGAPVDAAPRGDMAPEVPVDAQPIDAAAPPRDAEPPPLDAALRVDCPSACDHLDACLARPDVCPALSAVRRRDLLQQCVGLCSEGLAATILSQPCESIEQLIRGVANVLPEDCRADTARLPAAALARFTEIRPASGDSCALPAGSGGAFLSLTQTLEWSFDTVLNPVLPGFPGPALFLSLEGWPAGTTGNQAGEVQTVLWQGELAGGGVQLDVRLGQLIGWVNGAHLDTQPGALEVPAPALPMGPVRLRLRHTRITGPLDVTDAGLGLPTTVLTGYLDGAGLAAFAADLQQACTLPSPVQLQACAQLQATLDLRGTPQDVASRLWILLPPDAHLPDDGPPVPCADDDCDAISICLLAHLAPAESD